MMARRLFPLEYRIRLAPAYLYGGAKDVPPDIAIGQINEALKTNPNAMDLRIMRMKFMAQKNDMDDARRELKKLSIDVPQSIVIQKLVAASQSR